MWFSVCPDCVDQDSEQPLVVAGRRWDHHVCSVAPVAATTVSDEAAILTVFVTVDARDWRRPVAKLHDEHADDDWHAYRAGIYSAGTIDSLGFWCWCSYE